MEDTEFWTVDKLHDDGSIDIIVPGSNTEPVRFAAVVRYVPATRLAELEREVELSGGGVMDDTNVGMGMVPHKESCRCLECECDRKDKRIAELTAEAAQWQESCGQNYVRATEAEARCEEMEKRLENACENWECEKAGPTIEEIRADEREKCANIDPEQLPFDPDLLGIHCEEDAFTAGFTMGKGAMRAAIRALGDG